MVGVFIGMGVSRNVSIKLPGVNGWRTHARKKTRKACALRAKQPQGERGIDVYAQCYPAMGSLRLR